MNGMSPVVEPSTMSWALACEAIVDGKRVKRLAWPSDDQVFLHAGVVHLRKADLSLHTLIVSHGDLEATDWVVVREQ